MEKNNEQQKWNVILDSLRESGVMNMFGAPRWLNEEFGIPIHQAKEIFIAWSMSVNINQKLNKE